MDLKDILAISGYPGLFKFVSQGRNAIIVENLETKKRMSAFGSERISSLEEISVYTDEEDLPLVDVVKKIFEKEGNKPAIDPKSPPEKLKNYFSEIIPGYDRDRVYTSDIKKILTWYNLMHKLKMVKFDEEEEKEGKEQDSKEKKAGDSVSATGKKTAGSKAASQSQKASGSKTAGQAKKTSGSKALNKSKKAVKKGTSGK